MKYTLLATVAALGFVTAVVHAAAGPAGVEGCNDCHGANGVSAAQDVPTIAGVSATVQGEALKAYGAKSRPCPKVSYKRGDTQRQGDMCTIAKATADPAIAELVAFYSKQPYVAMKQPFDATKGLAGKTVHARDCQKCHSNGGRDPADDAGILAGQPLAWLKTSLAALRHGDIEQPKKMKEVVAKLSDADIENLANYYASEQ